MTRAEFYEAFRLLTGFAPFPWQWRLFKLFESGEFPRTCRLATGLGKTTLIVLWLLALAKNPTRVPRRLVYVVNRRTVVDQTTNEAERMRAGLEEVPAIRKALVELCAIREAEPDAEFCPLAISTLRGQFADNQQWSADPTRPAIISGTVDMIGSRLLFDGYRCGFKSKPLHAGLLGSDVLLIHDEAHLEPAFQDLLVALTYEQSNGRFPERDRGRRLRVIELSATTRNSCSDDTSGLFELDEEDRANAVVAQRLNAPKWIGFHEVESESDIPGRVAELAKEHGESNEAIVVFVRKVDDVKRVAEELTKGREENLPINVSQLTGTIRGFERDRLASKDPVFQRFLPPSNRNSEVKPVEGTVYLVANAAGEVGVNVSADHMVCDLSTFESTTQRLGRVNRFGEGTAAVDIVVPKPIVDADPTTSKPLELRMQRTFEVLSKLPPRDDGRFDASPAALESLPATERHAAFSPTPEILHVDEVLFDAWSLTSLSMPGMDEVPGRPQVEDWLHGVDEDVVPQAQVAWRREVEVVTDRMLAVQPKLLTREQILRAYPLKPHELLQDSVDRIFKTLVDLAKKAELSKEDGKKDVPVWIVDHRGNVESSTLSIIAAPDAKGNHAKRLRTQLTRKIVLLPPSIGGLSEGGMFVSKKSSRAKDVADEWEDDRGPLRTRYEGNPPAEAKRMRPVLRIRLSEEEDPAVEPQEWTWAVRRQDLDDESISWANSERQLLHPHLCSAAWYARRFVDALNLDDHLKLAVVVAAKYHDLGKARRLWQHGIGNRGFDPADRLTIWAKSGKYQPPLNKHYRHEFGTLHDVLDKPDFQQLGGDMQELALHLIAAHHGRARPHFPEDEVFDPGPGPTEADSQAIAIRVPARFAKIQRKYGRWQLAWLESLVRASDYLASQRLHDEAGDEEKLELADTDKANLEPSELQK